MSESTGVRHTDAAAVDAEMGRLLDIMEEDGIRMEAQAREIVQLKVRLNKLEQKLMKRKYK